MITWVKKRGFWNRVALNGDEAMDVMIDAFQINAQIDDTNREIALSVKRMLSIDGRRIIEMRNDGDTFIIRGVQL